MTCSGISSATSALGSEPDLGLPGLYPMPALILKSVFTMALLTSFCSGMTERPPALFDFGKGEVTNWRSLNDGVMGGRSIGVVDYTRGTMTWTGKVSLENNGGFSSVRSPWGRRDLSDFDSVTMRCRTTTGEADTFTLTMEVSEQWWMPYWKANFDVEPEWTEVTLPFDRLKKSSAYTGELSKFWTWGDLSSVLRMGYMKYDGTAGEFGLEVDWMRFNTAEVRN
jgi:hypothetical protein